MLISLAVAFTLLRLGLGLIIGYQAGRGENTTTFIYTAITSYATTTFNIPGNIQAQVGQAITIGNWKIRFVNWREITTDKLCIRKFDERGW
ncbi:MAG: hypothetical protein RQ885_12150 [Desulfurococcales archaeon]|jgi:hypothetical protein|nr:hypothetical protein [Desulfurococcales archaeon]